MQYNNCFSFEESRKMPTITISNYPLWEEVLGVQLSEARLASPSAYHETLDRTCDAEALQILEPTLA